MGPELETGAGCDGEDDGARAQEVTKNEQSKANQMTLGRTGRRSLGECRFICGSARHHLTKDKISKCDCFETPGKADTCRP